MKKKYNPALDIFGLFCSVLVVAEHLKPFNIDKNTFLITVPQTALFFFMMKCGYFFMHKLSAGTLDLKLFIKRLLIPAMFWSTVYNLYRLINVFLYHTETLTEYAVILFKSLLINGSGVHLWYLPTVVVCSVFVNFLFKKKRINIAYALGIVFYAMGLLSSTYASLDFLKLFEAFRNNVYLRTLVRVLFMGYPMFVLGVFIRDKRELVFRIPDRLLPFACIGSIIVSYFEIKIMKSTFNICSVFLAFYSFFFFIILIKSTSEKYANLGKIGKSISSFSYYTHPLFRIFFLTVLETVLKIHTNPSLIFILTLIGCFSAGIIVNRMNNKYLNMICG